MNDITEKDLFDPDTCDYTPPSISSSNRKKREKETTANVILQRARYVQPKD